MQVMGKRQLSVVVGLLSVSLISGCTNWRERYEYQSVELESLKGQHDKAKADQASLAARVQQDQETIDRLTQELERLRINPSDTGFTGDVSVDPRAGTITVTLQDTILFEAGKAGLKASTNDRLDEIISTLKSKYDGKLVDVIGHTDSDPIRRSGWKDNWDLSMQRAYSVLKYLENRGIPGRDLRLIGCGPFQSKADNTSSSGKARNRRVEIVVHMKNI